MATENEPDEKTVSEAVFSLEDKFGGCFRTTGEYCEGTRREYLVLDEKISSFQGRGYKIKEALLEKFDPVMAFKRYYGENIRFYPGKVVGLSYLLPHPDTQFVYQFECLIVVGCKVVL